MSAPSWIVESRNGNPAILVQQGDGTYSSIAHGNGEQSIEELLTLVRSANTWELGETQALAAKFRPGQ